MWRPREPIEKQNKRLPRRSRTPKKKPEFRFREPMHHFGFEQSQFSDLLVRFREPR